MAAVAAIVVWLSGSAAQAEEPPRLRGRHADGGGPRRMLPPEQLAEPSNPEAEAAERRGPGSRLSPEERRQLRRDVHQAGRDLYPERMPPGRRWRMRGE